MAINGKSILYHGTAKYHKTIDLSYGRPFTDFGSGYYLTSSLSQASKWAIGRGSKNSWVFEYNVSDATSNLLQLPLLECNMDWLDVILYYRIGRPLPRKERWACINKYDIIFDQMADGKITKLVQHFSSRKITKSALLQQAKGWKGQDQYCFKTQNAIKLLHRTVEYQYDPVSRIWIRRDAQ